MTQLYEARDLERTGNPPQKRYYLAGPMTCQVDRDYNYSVFEQTAWLLRQEGYDIMNPAEWGLRGKSRREIMEECISMLFLCDGIILLDGWSGSHGARTEVMISRELGLTIEAFAMADDGAWSLREITDEELIKTLGV